MNHVRESIHYSNHKIIIFDQISEIIVHLGSKKCENNYTSSFKLTYQNNQLLMSIVDTTEKDLSSVDGKYDIRKVRTTLVKS